MYLFIDWTDVKISVFKEFGFVSKEKMEEWLDSNKKNEYFEGVRKELN